MAAGAAADVPEKPDVRPPPSAVVVQPTPGARSARAAARVARARDDVGSRHEVRAARGPAPLDRAVRERIDHPDGRDARQARGPRKPVRPAVVARGGDDDEPGLARGREDRGAGRVVGVAKARLRRVVGEAQVDRLEVRAGRVRDGPVDGREDVGGARGLAAVARAEDLEDDEARLGREALRTREDAGDLGAVAAAVREVVRPVRDVDARPCAFPRAVSGRGAGGRARCRRFRRCGRAP